MKVAANALVLTIAVFLLLIPLSARAGQDETKSTIVQANGNGTLKLGDDEYKVTAVIIRLYQDGKAEMHIVSDITVLISGTWSRPDTSSKSITLKITKSAAGRVEATGELLIRPDGEAIERVSLQGQNRTSSRPLFLTFQGRS